MHAEKDAPHARGRWFILGAGASFAAGFPLADRVVTALYSYCAGIPFLPSEVRNGVPRRLLQSAASRLQQLMLDGAVHKDVSRFPLDVILEQFHGDALADSGQAQIELDAFYQGLVELMYCFSVRGISSYIEFARQLRAGDVVLTFNWDTCLEMALNVLGRPFQRDLGVHQGDRPRIFRIHGSIDYMSYETEVIRGQESTRQQIPEVLEPLGVKLPIVVGARGLSFHQLVRLRTYDLGNRVEVDWDVPNTHLRLNMVNEDHPVLDANHIDLGPLQLRHLLLAQALEVRPYTFVIAPGIPMHLARWSYEAVGKAIDAIEGRVGDAYVVGYSFPQYDGLAVDVLDRISARFGRPRAQVVDPYAGRLSQPTLNRIFSGVTLHECGFQDFPWAALSSRP